MRNHRYKGNIPVSVHFQHGADGARGKASWKAGGVKFTVCFEIEPETMKKIWAHMCRKSPYGANEFGFFKRIRRAVSKGVLRQVVNTIKQSSLLPRAASLANAVSKATGLPIGPSQISKAYDLAVAVATRNPAALRKARALALGAARGNPMANAALLALRQVSSYVPAVRKVAQPAIGAAPQYGYLPGIQHPAPLMLALDGNGYQGRPW